MTAAVEETGLGQAAGKAATLVRDSVKTVIAASMVGTAIEFYDFYAYGTAAANYFPHIFFSAKDNPTVALLMSLLTFAVAFIARPLGSLIFGHFGDRMGRKTTLVVSLMTMGVGTFLIGCLPTIRSALVQSPSSACCVSSRASAWAANGPARHWSPPRTRLKTSAHCTAPSRRSAPRSASSCPTAPTSCPHPSTLRTRCWLGAGVCRSCCPPSW